MRELSLHLLDVLENAVRAGATRLEVEIVEDRARNRLTISVGDNGRGMDTEMLARVVDPFFTTRMTRQVGLGLPLLYAAAQRCGGGLTVESRSGEGTRVVAEFELDHIDRAPLGNVPATLMSVLLAAEDCDLYFRHRVDDYEFELDTEQIRQVLGDVPLGHPQVRTWLEDYLVGGYADLYGASEQEEGHAEAHVH